MVLLLDVALLLVTLAAEMRAGAFWMFAARSTGMSFVMAARFVMA